MKMQISLQSSMAIQSDSIMKFAVAIGPIAFIWLVLFSRRNRRMVTGLLDTLFVHIPVDIILSPFGDSTSSIFVTHTDSVDEDNKQKKKEKEV